MTTQSNKTLQVERQLEVFGISTSMRQTAQARDDEGLFDINLFGGRAQLEITQRGWDNLLISGSNCELFSEASLGAQH